jgi:large subunit ribosomal protein L6
MSRIGKQQLTIPPGVSCSVIDDYVVCIGPQGKNTTKLPNGFSLQINGESCRVQSNEASAMWGTVVANLKNAITGVYKQFSQQINLVGVGYKAVKQGEILDLSLGYSHPVKFQIPQGVCVEVKKPTELLVTSCDKALLGRACALLAGLRKVEPYKHKGVHVVGRYYVKKEGKKK